MVANVHRRATQLALPSWGGRRKGAGRKPAGDRAGVAHRARPDHRARHPVHVTLRSGLNVLRRQRVFAAIRGALARASRPAFRVVHFSVQANHIHLIVEARDTASLSSGVRGLAIRAARGVNRVTLRAGRVWTDRYHARALETPREVRNALVYVLLNRKKHGAFPGIFGEAIDPLSSALWFDGWKRAVVPRHPPPSAEQAAAPCPVAAARTWLASIGWRRHGLLRPDEAPTST
jgi:REP element-mobilizing transposase RayT